MVSFLDIDTVFTVAGLRIDCGNLVVRIVAVALALLLCGGCFLLAYRTACGGCCISKVTAVARKNKKAAQALLAVEMRRVHDMDDLGMLESALRSSPKGDKGGFFAHDNDKSTPKSPKGGGGAAANGKGSPPGSGGDRKKRITRASGEWLDTGGGDDLLTMRAPEI